MITLVSTGELILTITQKETIPKKMTKTDIFYTSDTKVINCGKTDDKSETQDI